MQNIDIFPWNDHFETGLAMVDQQHRKLLTLLNSLATNIAFNANITSLNTIFDELTDYTIYHFQTEEAIWHKYLPNDPLDHDHQSVHQQFVSTALKFKEEQHNKPIMDLAREALEYLAKWLASHILETDRHMAYIIFALQDGLSLEEAKAHAQVQMSGSTRFLIDIILSVYSTLTSNTLELVHEMRENDKLLNAQKIIEEQLYNQDKYQKLLLEFSTSFINLPLDQIDNEIHNALEKMALFAKADRAYIFDYDWKTLTNTNTYEWCAEGISPQIQKLQNIPLKMIPEWFKTHRRGEAIVIHDVSELEEGPLKEMLVAEEIQSLVTLPLINTSECIGYVGFDAVVNKHDFNKSDIALLDLFSKLLFNVFEKIRVQRTLIESEQHFRTVTNTGSALIWTSGTDMLCNYFNEPWLNFTGRTLSQELGNGWSEGIHPDDFERCMEIYTTTFHQRKPFSLEYRLRKADGIYSWIIDNGDPRFDSEGTFIGYVGHCYDISERKKADEELQKQKEEFETIFNVSRDGIAILDLETNFLDFNNTYLEMTGFTREELLTKSCVGLSIPEDHERAIEALKIVLDKGFITNFEKTCLVKDNKQVIINMAIVLMPDKQRILISTKDITEAKAQEQKLHYIAHYDALTGLPNRVLLSDRLQQAIAQATRNRSTIAIVYLDLDGFKEINDLYGHKVGDILLSRLAGRMKQSLRDGDTIARLGGDEFVAVLLDLKDHEDCVPMLIRLLSLASENITIDGISINVSASLGVSFFEEDNNLDADQLLRQADQAMYQAKLSGKNRYHIFDAVQDRTIRTHHESLEAIEHALIHNEFILYYQPKVNMHTGKVIGAEALIRWNHPEKGILPPAAFLPTIDGHRLSIQVGKWVIEQAMRQIKDFKQQGLHFPISVNIDALQLQQDDFLQHLQALLTLYPEVIHGDLEFEILETSALEDITHISYIIQGCHEMGIHFSLDDFGTGYSSLTYLKRLQAQTLKIDRSFVQGMLSDPDDLAILDGIIGLSVAFRRDVIAEGVESIEHGEMLLRLGCVNAQGYIIAKPMPPEELHNWVTHWTPDLKWHKANRVRRNNIPLLFAAVEHKAWTSKVLAYMKYEQQELFAIDSSKCNFGQWINEYGEKHYGGYLFFPEIVQIHNDVHEIANQMLQQKSSGESFNYQEPIDKLLLKSDRLINLLKQLEN
ncbi:MAG: bacteriohemerythrin [Sulfuricurvum sp.]|nr:bacteriohemerythrin [Sulfuricurvum sp.]